MDYTQFMRGMKGPQRVEYRCKQSNAVLTQQQVQERCAQSGLSGAVSLDQIGVKMVTLSEG